MSGTTIPNSQRVKDVNAIKDFTLDWSDWLSEVSDTIATATWTVPSGITKASESNTATTATVFLSGGTVGQSYIVYVRVTTVGGRTDDQAIEITVIDSAALAVDHYCTLDDVNQLVPQAPYSDTSKPNQAVVLKLIDQVANLMDASMANIGYVTPVVSGTVSLEMLRLACAMGTVGLCQQIRDTGVRTAVTDSGATVTNIWTQQFDAWIKRLISPEDPFELPDAPRTTQQLQKQGDLLVRSFVQSIPADDTSYDPDNPVITRYQAL